MEETSETSMEQTVEKIQRVPIDYRIKIDELRSVTDSLQQPITKAVAETVDVLKQIQGIDRLSKVYTELSNLMQAALTCSERKQKVMLSCEETHKEWLTNSSALQLATLDISVDQQTKDVLNQQIIDVTKQVETLSAEEELRKEEVRHLRGELNALTATIKQGVTLSSAQEKAINMLLSTKDQYAKELEEEVETIMNLRTKITEFIEKIRTSDAEKRILETDILRLKEEQNQRKFDVEIEQRSKDAFDIELRDIRGAVSTNAQELKTKQDAASRISDDISILESQIKVHKQMITKMLSDQEANKIMIERMKNDLQEQELVTNALIAENVALQKDVKKKELDTIRQTNENKSTLRVRDALHERLSYFENERIELEIEKRAVKAATESTLGQIEAIKHAIEADKKVIEDLGRERELVKQKLGKTESSKSRNYDSVVLMEQLIHTIELEVCRVTSSVERKEAMCITIEEHRQRYLTETVKVQRQIVLLTSQAKDKQVELFALKKKMAYAETKLKHQQNLYETAQSDRNLQSKQLLHHQSEISEMKRKLKVMTYQINGHKEDIVTKKNEAAREAKHNDKLQQDIQKTQEESKTLKSQNDLAQQYIRVQVSEEMKLNQFVKEADAEKCRQDHCMSTITTERDNLNSQLIKQNLELNEVYKKIKSLHATLLRGEKHYMETVRNHDNVLREIKQAFHEKEIVEEKVGDVHDLYCTTKQAESRLNCEQNKIRALEEYLKHPINIHRWREMEGNDPKRLELLQMLQSLRKKLITLSEEEKEKEQLIHSTEKLYLHLKNMSEKQVGQETLEQISEYEKVLKTKKMQLRHMGTELNMYQAQANEYKHAIESLDHQMLELRQSFLKRKKLEWLEQSAQVKERFQLDNFDERINHKNKPEEFTSVQ